MPIASVTYKWVSKGYTVTSPDIAVKKAEIQQYIIRTLLGREAYGYEIAKELTKMGLSVRPNYVYMILAGMERRGWLKSRWVHQASGPRKHLYLLNDAGEREVQTMLRDSIELLLEVFLRKHVASGELSGGRAVFRALNATPPTGRLVIAMPDANPVSPLPIFLSSFADEYPDASVYLVKPPGVLLTGSAPNLKVLDGQRYDIPLRDGFADTVFTLGLPKGVPEKKTVAECARVVNDVGQVIIKIPNVMTSDSGSNGPSFAEFVARTYYDVIEQDRTVRIEDVRTLLSSFFGEVRDKVWGGSTYLHAWNRKPHAARPNR